MPNIESFVPELLKVLNSIAEPKITDWITVVVVIINLIISGIIIAQFFIAKDSFDIAKKSFDIAKDSFDIAKQSFEEEHEKARREKAIEVLMFWDETLTRSSTLARKFVENFTFDQAKELLEQKAVTQINKKYKNNLLTIFPDIEKQGQEGVEEINDNLFTLKQEFSGLLRWEIISYLNNLETVLAAWSHNVCDQDMIEEQFKYLVSTQNNHFLLENFRQACGPFSYPCIHKFIQHLKDAEKPINPSKDKLGSKSKLT